MLKLQNISVHRKIFIKSLEECIFSSLGEELNIILKMKIIGTNEGTIICKLRLHISLTYKRECHCYRVFPKGITTYIYIGQSQAKK